jgi:serine/threonine protein phosphatase PrpC
MICPVCGANNREDARFCRSCGTSLVEPPPAEVEPAVEPIEVPPGEPEFGAEAVEPPVEEPLPAAPTESPAAGAGEEPEAGPEGESETTPDLGTEEIAQAEGEVVDERDTGPVAVQDQEAPSPGPEGAGGPEQEVEEEEEEEGVERPPESEADVVGFWRDEAEPLAELEPGTVIAGRYVLVEALDVQQDEILYLARDLQKCWQCGFEGNAPDEAFCAQCGASLGRKPEVHLVQVREVTAGPSSDQEVASWLEDEGLHFVVLVEPEPEVELEVPEERQGVRLVVGQRSDVGQVRELDEDSLLALTLAPTYESRTNPVLGLFAVADGMGGHEGGEVASKLALQILAEQVLEAVILPEFSTGPVAEDDIVVRLQRATMAANDAVYLARQKAANDMGTTLTAGYVRNDQLFLAHVGDSRAYRWSADGLAQLTTDHSVIASMIDSGQAAPEEIYTHPHRSVIYRSIGDKPAVEVDTDLLPLSAGDRLVFCCDGLWETIRNEGIADAMMQEADPQVACDVMVKRANTAGGEDNISVIVVQVEGI